MQNTPVNAKKAKRYRLSDQPTDGPLDIARQNRMQVTNNEIKVTLSAKFDLSLLECAHVDEINFFSTNIKNYSWENTKQSSFRNFFQNTIISISSWVMLT